MKFAHFDAETGAILGFYDPAIHEAIPEPRVEIDEDAWRGHLTGEVRVAVDPDTGALVAHVPPEPTPEEIATRRLSAAKTECRRRIYTAASAETQMNMATAAAVTSAKPVNERSDDEVALLAGVAAALGWVEAMRAQCLALAEDPGTDITADASWPPVPPEAAAVAAMF